MPFEEREKNLNNFNQTSWSELHRKNYATKNITFNGMKNLNGWSAIIHEKKRKQKSSRYLLDLLNSFLHKIIGNTAKTFIYYYIATTEEEEKNRN